MAKLSILRRTFGNVIKIAGYFQQKDYKRFDEAIVKLISLKSPVFLDLVNYDEEDDISLRYLLSKVKELSNSDISVTVLKAPPKIRQIIKMEGNDKPVVTLDYMDEAIFPTKNAVKPKFDTSIPQTEQFCPSCSVPIRSGAVKCLHCGFRVAARRGERRSISIPFLFSMVPNSEFFDTNWKGCVTEDVDLKTFSGLGFFTTQRIVEKTSLHFVFPTLQWNSDTVDHTTLLIFTGRVKHCTLADKWTRIGVALIDVIEYTGKFDVKSEVDSHENN